MMIQLEFDKDICAAAPALKVLQIEADVVCCDTSDALWREIEECYAHIHDTLPMAEVRLRPAIDATRAAYKVCGKDPNRYRPSAEALCRRAVRGLELYRTLSVIDLINLLSMLTGHSIGGFDAEKIVGTTLTLGVGAEGEPYEAIGRGELNIAGLPVYRDAVGGIGTPTSDNERTKLSFDTRRLLITLNIYGDEPAYGIDALEALACRLLTDYAGAKNIETRLYNLADENS
jgi:DNA/RNA-binding domain of Phe-tRNA-synthetase-like protein